MNLVGKIFVVLILLMSFLFMGFAVRSTPRTRTGRRSSTCPRTRPRPTNRWLAVQHDEAGGTRQALQGKSGGRGTCQDRTSGPPGPLGATETEAKELRTEHEALVNDNAKLVQQSAKPSPPCKAPRITWRTCNSAIRPFFFFFFGYVYLVRSGIAGRHSTRQSLGRHLQQIRHWLRSGKAPIHRLPGPRSRERPTPGHCRRNVRAETLSCRLAAVRRTGRPALNPASAPRPLVSGVG